MCGAWYAAHGIASASIYILPRSDGCTFRLPKGYVGQPSHRSAVRSHLFDKGFELKEAAENSSGTAQAIISTVLVGSAITSTQLVDATRGETVIELSLTQYEGPFYDEVFIRKPVEAESEKEER